MRNARLGDCVRPFAPPFAKSQFSKYYFKKLSHSIGASVYRESDMNAHALLNLLNKLGEKR